VLDNGSESTCQRYGIHRSLEELLDVSFSMRSLPYQKKQVDYTRIFPEVLIYLINKLVNYRSLIRSPIRSLDFATYLILPAALYTLGSSHPLSEIFIRYLPGMEGRRVRLTTSVPSVSRLSIIYQSFDSYKLMGLCCLLQE
jgi:hypothetical protein